MFFPSFLLLNTSPLTKARGRLIRLNSFQKEVPVGILLDDGWLQKRNENQNTRFGFAQSGKEEKREYFYLVFNLFLPFCSLNYKAVTKNVVRKGYDTIHTSILFVTIRLFCFNYYYSLFYPNRKKHVPLNIIDIFTAASLAHFIMCDGSKHNKGLHLNTYGFDQDSVNRLIMVLETKFEVECTIHKHKSGPRIYIPQGSIDKVRVLVKLYMIPSMVYKIGN